MFELDQPENYANGDPTGLRWRIKTIPQQCQAAWNVGQSARLPEGWGGYQEVVVGGMGGSAIAGDLAASLAQAAAGPKVSVVRDWRFPGPLTPRSLCILCSFSGNTEETLALYDRVVDSDADVAVITGGGALEARAEASGVPVLRIDAPGEPRSAVAFNLMLLMALFDRTGIMEMPKTEVDAAVAAATMQITRFEESVPTPHNLAKSLALDLQGRLVLVYGGGLLSGMGLRWKGQLNENAKAWAFSETIPELLHNSVESYANKSAVQANATVLLLEPADSPNGLEKRYRALSGLLENSGIRHHVLRADAGPPLAQMMSMLAMGDYVSFYLALLNGVEPSATPMIDTVKSQLT